jgi:Tfp pilus assembly protein PilO
MKLPGRKSRSMLATVLVAVASIAYVFFVFLPGQKAIGELHRELTKKQQYILDADRLSQAIEQVRHDFESGQAFTSVWCEAAPSEPELAALMGRITEEAKAAETAIVRLDRRTITRQETIWHVSVVLECRGRFEQVFELVRRLEAVPQDVWITDLHLERSSEDAELVEAELVLTIFADNSEDSD